MFKLSFLTTLEVSGVVAKCEGGEGGTGKDRFKHVVGCGVCVEEGGVLGGVGREKGNGNLT